MTQDLRRERASDPFQEQYLSMLRQHAYEHFLKADRALALFRVPSEEIDLRRLAQTIMDDRVCEAVGIGRLTRRVLVLAGMIELRKQQAGWAPRSSEALERVERDLMGWKGGWSGLSREDLEVAYSFVGVLLHYCDPTHWPPELVAECACADTRWAIRNARLRGDSLIRDHVRKWAHGWKRFFPWCADTGSDLGVDWLRRAAELGNVVAEQQLAECYAAGEGVVQNDTLAAAWYRKAAEKGDHRAQHVLGFYCDRGKGVPQDINEAVRWYRASAEHGYAPAQFNLGCCYLNGSGVEQDDVEASKWFQMAASRELADAQCNLGVCYFEGRGVPQDYTQAAEYYRKAANQGYAQAQYNLATCCCDGLGVSQDFVEAYKWLHLIPFGRGFGLLERARKLQAEIAAKLKPEEIAEALRRADSFRRGGGQL
jgi:hypothetical protein